MNTPKTTLIILRRLLGYGLVSTFAAILSIAIFVLNQKDDLHLWHTVELDEEFSRKSDVPDFEAYLELENRLFQQLEEEVYQQLPKAEGLDIQRFHKGSMMDPSSMPTNWNRTFVLKNDRPSSGILLLHGMSDSPYSLHHLGESLHQQGASVIGLRIPGHGTAPSGLVETTWQDMAKAVELAVVHLKEEVGDKPVYLVGYSNGAALSVAYSLEALDDSSLPAPDGLVLFSPAIGVTKSAALAVWQGRIGNWLGLGKLAWNSISHEHDPFKYGSFAINAGDQAYRITRSIDRQLAKLADDERLVDFPPVLAFQSAVDATVSPNALVTRLFNRLPDNHHELVIFDVNRFEVIDHLLSNDPNPALESLKKRTDRNFTMTVLRNTSESSRSVTVHTHPPHGGKSVTEATSLEWPLKVFSLSHVAIPFPESDPVYGSGLESGKPTLGNLALRGERNTLRISPNDMLRQRWNPFYSWIESNVLEFCFPRENE